MINHIHHEFPKCRRIDTPEGRLYASPSGNKYPSVTTVVSLASAKAIKEWREAVGEKEANAISARASKRGTAIHSLCEQYLYNKPVEPNVFDADLWRSMKPALGKINNVHCLETQLYSDYLQVAGTVDCVAEYNGRLSIIDFKTSRRQKTRDDINTYFMQTAAYAVMFEERTGIPVSRLVILMGVDDQPEASIFVERRDDWIGEFIALRKEYRKWKNV